MAAGERWPSTSLQCGLLGVLLISRGEVMDGILDHVPWIHGLLQAAGNALHWGTAAIRVKSFVHVDLVSEGMPQSNSSKEHLNADNKVLVTGGNCSLANREVSRADLRDGSTFLQDGQQHPLPEGEKDD